MPATFAADSSTTSQLFFDFEPAGGFAATALLDPPPAAKVREFTSGYASDHDANDQADRPSLYAVRAEDLLPRRGAGEVRIGNVMLQLLKRYGITDEEIEEGLADYARTQVG